jgi:hypothetical protein
MEALDGTSEQQLVILYHIDPIIPLYCDSPPQFIVFADAGDSGCVARVLIRCLEGIDQRSSRLMELHLY